MALLNYRTPDRAQRALRAQLAERTSARSAAAAASRSSRYLDFHGNKFTRRFDANSYVTLVEAMNSHDVGRDRGGVAAALGRVTARDARARHRQRPAVPRRRAAARSPRGIPDNIDGDRAVVLASDYGHDGFLIETLAVGMHVRRLLDAPAR